MQDDTKQILKEFIQVTKIDKDVIKGRWASCESITDEKIRLIAIGVLQNNQIYAVYTKWSGFDLKNYGIESFSTFWQKTMLDNLNKITSEQDAINVMHEVLQKRLRGSRSEEFSGIIIAENQKKDTFVEYIDLILDMYKADPISSVKIGYDEKTGIGCMDVFNNVEEVIEKYTEKIVKKLTPKYFIDGKIVIPIGATDIDITFNDKKFKRTKWYNGKFAGKPVLGTSYMKGLTLIAKPKDGQYEKYSLILNDKQCDMIIPSCKHVKFLANPSPSHPDRLNATPDMKFEIIGDGEFDITIADKVLKTTVIEFGDMLDYVRSMDNKNRYDTKGVWVKVLEAPPTEGTRYMVVGNTKEKSLDDMGSLFDDSGKFDDDSMHCTIPDNIDIKFGESSNILLFGSPRYGSSFVNGKWEQDTNKVSMWLSGIYVPKDQQVEITHTVDVSESELNESFEDVDTSKDVVEELNEL